MVDGEYKLYKCVKDKSNKRPEGCAACQNKRGCIVLPYDGGPPHNHCLYDGRLVEWKLV